MNKVRFNSEKDLEDYICEYIDNNGSCPITDSTVDHYWRQVAIGSYGIADVVKVMVDFDGSIHITVLELKNTDLTLKCMSQVLRYATGINHFIEKHFPNSAEAISVHPELLGAGFEATDDTCFMFNYLDSINAYSFDLDVEEGFVINRISPEWRSNTPNFKSKNTAISLAIKKMSINNARDYKRYLSGIPNRKMEAVK
jgi:hypothetical protein